MRWALPIQLIQGLLALLDDRGLAKGYVDVHAILEEMARRIFEEWFVHFRAAGCEGLPFADSPLGPIPQGWEVVPLETFCSRVHSPPSVTDGRPMLSVKGMRS
jgi:hypothetical protein